MPLQLARSGYNPDSYNIRTKYKSGTGWDSIQLKGAAVPLSFFKKNKQG